jgi:hypothetical protein
LSQDGESLQLGQRGRPRRQDKAIVVRGTVPEHHPLVPFLQGMSPARACTFILEHARLQLLQDDAPSLRLNPAKDAAHSVRGVDQPDDITAFDDIRDLVDFAGIPPT